MAEEFLLVNRRQMEELRSAIELMQEHYEALLRDAGVVSFPSLPTMLANAPTFGSRAKKYNVGRGAYSYADVVWKEISAERFYVEDAIQQIEPLIDTSSDRWKESFRRSIQNDERFQALDESGWFRKVHPDERRGSAPQPLATRPEPARTSTRDYDDFMPPSFGEDDDDDLPFK